MNVVVHRPSAVAQLDELEVWVQRAIVTWPRGSSEDVLVSAAIAGQLRAVGASCLQDFVGLSLEEAVIIWQPFAVISSDFVGHLLQILPQVVHTIAPSRALVSSSARSTVLAHPMRERTPPRSHCTPGLPTLAWGMALLRSARLSQAPPPPDQFAEVIRRLGQIPAGAMQARWRKVAVAMPPELPRARAVWQAALPPV